MSKKRNSVRLLSALMLPLIAVGGGLQSCSEDGPKIPVDEVSEGGNNIRNLLTRSPEEAIDIAQRAWDEFYGDEVTQSSRSARGCVIDYGRPVEIVKGAKSRGGSGSDTLLYVVNFADDGGFAVIAAPRYADELLAITSQGHYYPESQADEEKAPGFELWMENAQAYAASVDAMIDYGNWMHVDTTQNNGLPDSVRILPDIPKHPGDPVYPPFTRDTTKTIDPDNPGFLQHKEWNDTVYNLVVKPQVRNSWGQGINGENNLILYPEGYLFANGLCGCGPLAIAEACLFYEKPQQVFIFGEYKQLDWNKMKMHRQWPDYSEDYIGKDLCPESYRELTHNMIAWLCKAIGDKAGASIYEKSTGISKSNCLSTLKYFLQNHEISNDWTSYYNTNVLPLDNQLMLVRAENQEANRGHVWICDGAKWIEYDHYYATRENSGQMWKIQAKTHAIIKYSHFNWGWFGEKNGWYNQSVITFSDDNKIYHNFQYVYIK